jgi:galactose-1-phosphate uridylyltransferase
MRSYTENSPIDPPKLAKKNRIQKKGREYSRIGDDGPWTITKKAMGPEEDPKQTKQKKTERGSDYPMEGSFPKEDTEDVAGG